MNDTARQFRDFFVSLKLTVVLLVLGMLLVFAATLDQVNLGIWAVQEKYFRSFIVLWRVGDVPIPVFPGGYFIGGLLLVNLVAAHLYRFKRSWKKAGIELTHAGLILLLIGELFTGLWQEDYSMRLEPGVPTNYSISFHDNELAVIDTTDAQFDDVVAIPETLLNRGQTVQHPKLPFRVVAKAYYPNAATRERKTGATAPAQGDKGAAIQYELVPVPVTYKQNERNVPGLVVELIGAEGSLGTWITHADFRPQSFQYGGRNYTVGFRFTRKYKPFTLTLLKFSHDRYAGTDIPKNFSSSVRIQTPDGVTDREVLIYMNNPLRYEGLTFFQASFEGEDVTVLQVVRNPSWLIPYIACAMMTLGLVVQFCIHLFGFINKRRAARPSQA